MEIEKTQLFLLPISVLKVEYQVGIIFSISNFFINKMYQHVLYLHSRRPSYESYQMDCFATFAKIRLFWRNCKKWQNNPADISEDFQSCPEATLHDCWGFKIHKFLVFITTVILTSNRELHFLKSFFESVLQLTLQIVYVLKF